jgi:hypothetical protein
MKYAFVVFLQVAFAKGQSAADGRSAEQDSVHALPASLPAEEKALHRKFLTTRRDRTRTHRNTGTRGWCSRSCPRLRMTRTTRLARMKKLGIDPRDYA